jgi:EamA-like transporter family
MNNDDITGSITSLTQESVVSASAWMKGISLSVLASIIGGASKLAIRKSWVIEQQQQQQRQQQEQNQQQPLTANTESTIDIEPLSINDGDTHVQYSQITSNVDSDAHQLGSFNDEMIPTIDDDHYSRHRHIESSPNRYIPIILRTCGMIGMTALNPLCSVLAMNYASPSILAPFSGLTLVWIVLFSEALVGEKPTVRQVIAAALIVIGEVVIAVFGDHTNDEGISVDEVVR